MSMNRLELPPTSGDRLVQTATTSLSDQAGPVTRHQLSGGRPFSDVVRSRTLNITT